MGNACADNPKVESIWFPEFERNLPSMTGKRIAITGTTSGTGRVAAMTCLKKGATLYMLNRESERSARVLQELQEAVPGANVRQIPCDLTDFASVREAGRLLHEACEGCLDVLCCNAGIANIPVVTTTNRFTKDGYGSLMQSNHLSHFLLTKEMMPALRAAAAQNGEARVISHTSLMRSGKPLDPKYLAKDSKIDESDTYHQSKLANCLYTFELADRLAAENIKAVVCAPGVAATNAFDEFPGCFKRAMNCTMLSCGLIQSAEDGTMALLDGIASPGLKSGDLLTPSHCGEIKGPVRAQRRPLNKQDECQNKESQQMLWRESEKAIGEEFKL